MRFYSQLSLFKKSKLTIIEKGVLMYFEALFFSWVNTATFGSIFLTSISATLIYNNNPYILYYIISGSFAIVIFGEYLLPEIMKIKIPKWFQSLFKETLQL